MLFTWINIGISVQEYCLFDLEMFRCLKRSNFFFPQLILSMKLNSIFVRSLSFRRNKHAYLVVKGEIERQYYSGIEEDNQKSNEFFLEVTEKADEQARIKRLIKENTCITRNSLTPEICLHLITPSCSLWTSPIEEIPFKDPFWAFYWPGGQALTRYILDNPQIVRTKIVLDIGSGCGATAIAAAISEAKNVKANDIDPVAACAISLNSALNNVNVSICTEQLIGKAVNDGTVILVGDMFYDEEFSDSLMYWLKVLKKEGKEIYIGDPGRLPFKKHEQSFQCVKKYPLTHEDLSPGFSNVLIWKMK